jgi:hypothetical protein
MSVPTRLALPAIAFAVTVAVGSLVVAHPWRESCDSVTKKMDRAADLGTATADRLSSSPFPSISQIDDTIKQTDIMMALLQQTVDVCPRNQRTANIEKMLRDYPDKRAQMTQARNMLSKFLGK